MKIYDWFIIYFFAHMISQHLMLVMMQHYLIGGAGAWLFWTMFDLYCKWRATNAN